MLIKTIASSSKGNCYLIDDNKTKIIIEAGISTNKIIKEVGRLSDISACLITHEHGDHSSSANDLTKKGVTVYCTEGTASNIEIQYFHRIFIIEYEKQYDINSFIIKPFKTFHDTSEPCGFLIYSKETKETLIFATDTAFMEFYCKANYIMIECNYEKNLLENNYKNNVISSRQYGRVAKTHFEYSRCIDFLKKCCTDNTKAIYLLHCSDKNFNKMFIDNIKNMFNTEVIALYE
jgi:phosphoribosyl 1,2-cyclic phosphodiesterase